MSCSYTETHQSDCSTTPVSVSVLTVAMQQAAQMGAGVQGDVGCTVDPTAAQLAGWMALTPNFTDGIQDLGIINDTSAVMGAGDGDIFNVSSGDGNTLVVGDGLGDQINLNGIGDGNVLLAGNGDSDFLTVATGDNNVLWAGDGNGDQVAVYTGNNNDLHADNGDGAFTYIFTGDHNCLTVGDGATDGVYVGTGLSNELTAGNGDGDVLRVDTGDYSMNDGNNLLTAGNGAHDYLSVGTGGHNTLIAGNGDGDILQVYSGNYNYLHAGDGAGDQLTVSDGDFNALIAGHGDGDVVSVLYGDNNVLAVGDGAHDTLSLGGGNSNIILDGNGANDLILVDGATYDTTGHVGGVIGIGNVIVMGNGDGDQAWGGLGDGNSYLTGAGNDLVHTGGGADFVYVDNHTETATPSDPYHLTSTDSLAQNLYADGGNDTFAIQGAIVNTYNTCHSWHTGGCYEHAITWDTSSHYNDTSTPSLGTTVMTGGGGVEKYWVDGSFGNAVVTDFNSANGDRVMVGGVWDGTSSTLSSLGTVHTEYVHSAYDTANTGNVDLLITFTSGQTQGSITLIDFLPQDTGGTGGAEQFNNVTFTNAAAAESTLAHIFDFNQADNQAVTAHVASLAAANLILH